MVTICKSMENKLFFCTKLAPIYYVIPSTKFDVNINYVSDNKT